MMDTVGVVGLGNIGGRVAEVLLAEYEAVLFDIDENRLKELADQGAHAADSGADVGRRADVVLLSLPADEALLAATLDDDGVVEGLSEGDVLIDTSTVSPMASKRVADACAEAGIEFLDAPVSGGARNAATGSLTMLVGGPAETLDAVRPVLETIGETIHHVGETGAGASLKVINNYMFGMNQLVLSEGLAMARASGIDDEVFAETVADASGASYALDRNMERFILPDEFDSEFTLSLMCKDVTLAERFAADHEVSLLLGGASGLYRLAERLGYGDLDASAVVKLLVDE
ncbi:NAD(P)-dependent oxidoreductase [Natronosalvus halobius]|uniref:NAD(P)-dependent oxidoreductase n=1 Tax=Natronosalvus halobius TaxID=2953746 RepID=UPI0020A08DAC|nr:NAD(P)-dependent oxidoreductase [Natronosalvus halobius]USZ73576.1 NAD(P)-dependent oxidoreductase [Natronosalvus halobius]